MKEPRKAPSTYYTVEMIARTLCVSTRTVHRLIETAALHSNKIGHLVRISSDDLDLYLMKSRK